jgi:hypothetical protein
VSDVAGITRLLRPEQMVANLRIQPIRADDQIGFRLATVLE